MPKRCGDYRGYGGGGFSEAIGVCQFLNRHTGWIESEQQFCDMCAFVALNHPQAEFIYIEQARKRSHNRAS